MLDTRDEMERNPAGRSKFARPEHSLLQLGKESGQPRRSAYLPSGTLPSGTDALQDAGSTEQVAPARGLAMIDPIIQPVGAGGAAGPFKPNLLYGPPLLVYEGETREDVPTKAFTTPRFTAFGGTSKEEEQKARHFLGLVKIYASVTKNTD
jgi:hypothetical protein